MPSLSSRPSDPSHCSAVRCIGLVLLAALCLALPAAAGAAPPRDFFGVMVDGPMIEPSGVDVAAEARVMRRAGVGAARVVLYWDEIEPQPGQQDWSRYDALVGALARERIRVLPVLYRAPAWARTGDPADVASPPRLDEFARFAEAAVRRYGAGGSFWRADPGLPRREVRQWQIWNEPNLEKYWAAPPWGLTYTELLRVAHRAVKTADRRAQVVTAGLTGATSALTEELYRSGAEGAFDAVGIHPYRPDAEGVVAALGAVRRVIRRNGDRAGIVASEVSFSSGLGHSRLNYGIERTETGQRRVLEELLPRLVRERRRLGLSSVHWYTWMSWPLGREVSFDYSGLRRLDAGGAVVSKPALAGYRRVAG